MGQLAANIHTWSQSSCSVFTNGSK